MSTLLTPSSGCIFYALLHRFKLRFAFRSLARSRTAVRSSSSSRMVLNAAHSAAATFSRHFAHLIDFLTA